tara:strand:- start:3293 stop:3685 length:393 start_codon:yes stop_codon:yes gene_type:complete
MALTIRYGSYCVPQEQVGADKPFWLDGDSTGKLSGSATETVTSYVAPLPITETTLYNLALDFIAVKALNIETGSYILISLDSGDSYPIRLLKDECFASKIAPTARLRVAICTALNGSGTGVGKAEVWSGT